MSQHIGSSVSEGSFNVMCGSADFPNDAVIYHHSYASMIETKSLLDQKLLFYLFSHRDLKIFIERINRDIKY